MRWPRLKRRSAKDAASSLPSTAFTPGSWGQPASPVYPQPEATAVAPQIGNVEVIAAPPLSTAAPQPVAAVPAPLVGPPVTAPAPQAAAPLVAPPAEQPAPAVAAAPPSPPEENTGVRLGFADGSDLHLDPDDPHTLALKAVADVLVHGGPYRRKQH